MISSKTYAFGQKTDTQTKFDEEDKNLRLKWAKDFEENKIQLGNITPDRKGPKHNNERKNRQVIRNDNNEIEIVETCIMCNIAKPITPLFWSYIFIMGSINNIDRASGSECITNSDKDGCRICRNKLADKRRENRNEYIRILLHSYPNLNNEWYECNPNICAISNIQLNEKHGVEWRISIQNNGLNKDHLPETCVKIAYEFNVQEQKAIPNLIACWKEAFQLFLVELTEPTDTNELVEKIKQWWNNTPTENGVSVPSEIIVNGTKKRNPEYSKLYNTRHLPAILNDLSFRCKHADKVSKRDPAISGICANKYQIYEKLLKQQSKCYYTGIPFSLNRDNWRYFSLERLNNNMNHTDENTVLICRMFNTAGQLNRKKILTALLSQIHISLSVENIHIINSELEKINNG
jgi:hypothetical protein